eukprot:TRINITY_DN538_c0_g1_i1.p1 TRINITY_DN538_c0_g1~~TRINITY_DN538_c0_g1_i1.p1  ORF type:complete len:60 (+),score=9.33 TRINITY_DN538_c0_g1_i1:46-225(+)
MSTSSYDMETGDVEFNDEYEPDSSAMETGATMSTSVKEMKIPTTPEVLNPVACAFSSAL